MVGLFQASPASLVAVEAMGQCLRRHWTIFPFFFCRDRKVQECSVTKLGGRHTAVSMELYLRHSKEEVLELWPCPICVKVTCTGTCGLKEGIDI
jgi:hypothetical protein